MSSHSQCRIREIGSGDSALAAEIIRQAFCDVAAQFGLTAQNCPTHPSNCRPAWIDKSLSSGNRFYLLESSADVVGCVGMTAPKDGVCELMRLGVLPQHRHQGYGALLVQHVLEQARALDLKRVDIGIIAAHTSLRRWYERIGFVAGRTVQIPHLPFKVTFLSLGLTAQ